MWAWVFVGCGAPVEPPSVTCADGEAHVAGAVGDVSFAWDGAFDRIIHLGQEYLGVGTEGIWYLDAPADGRADGWFRVPEDQPDAGAWYCLDGVDQTLAPGDVYAATAGRVTRAGPCPGEPVDGDVVMCLSPQDCDGAQTVQSTLDGAPFDLDLTFVLGTQTAERVFFEGFTEGAALRLDTFDVDYAAPDVEVAEIADGWLVVPPGLPDAGAIYCAGPGSTLEYAIDAPDIVRPITVELHEVTRVACPPRAEVEGALAVCADPLDET